MRRSHADGVAPTERVPRRSRWKTWLWGVLVCVFVAVAAGLFLYRRYTDPERIRVSAEAYLQRYINGFVSVGSARFSWLEGISIFDVAIYARDDEGASTAGSQPGTGFDKRREPPILQCARLELHADRGSMLGGTPAIDSIVAISPTLTLVRNLDTGRTNIAGLFRAVSDADLERRFALPTVELRDARVLVVARSGSGDGTAPSDRVVEDLQITVRGRRSTRHPQWYDLVWEAAGRAVSTGQSRLDLRTGRLQNVSGGLPWLSMEAVMIAVNSAHVEAGTWFDLLGLSGRVRAVDYRFDDTAGHGDARSATIELNGASLSIPISASENDVRPEQRYLRFDNANGTVTVKRDGIDAEFDALLHGARCHVSTQFRGGVSTLASLDDVDFEAVMSIKGLVLPRMGDGAPPEQDRFLRRFPKLMRVYELYDPQGVVDVDISVAKQAGVGEPVHVRHVVVRARDGGATCRFFPYSVTNVTGVLDVRPEGVSIHDLCGHHGSGEVCVNGSTVGLGPCASVSLVVEGRRITIDDALIKSVPKGTAGRVRRQYNPEGTLDIHLEMERDNCAKGRTRRWRSAYTLSFDDLAARYTPVPYPLEHLSGSISVNRQQIDVMGIRGVAGDGMIRVDGVVTLAAGKADAIELDLRLQDLVLDDGVFAVIPSSIRDPICTFHPDGHVDVNTFLHRDGAAMPVTHESTVRFADLSIRHDRFAVPIESVRGTVRVDSFGLDFDDVTGRCRGGSVDASGVVDWRDADRRRADVSLRFGELIPDEEFQAYLPPGLGAPGSVWSIEGPIDLEAQLSVRGFGESGEMDVEAVARLDGVPVKYAALSERFEDVRGEIKLGAGGMTAERISGRYGQGRILAAFHTVHVAGGTSGLVSLDAENVRLDRSVRLMLPEEMRAPWDLLSPSGRIDLHLDRLAFEREDAGGPSQWSVEGSVDLVDVALPGAWEVARLNGTASISGHLADRLGGMSLEGTLNLASAEIQGRKLSSVSSPWMLARTADRRGRFVIEAIEGRIYHGSVTGRVDVTSDKAKSAYDITATVRGMNVEPFLRAGEAGRSAPKEHDVAIRGKTDAHFYVSGIVGDESSRRGGGRVQIVDGQKKRTPLLQAILDVLKLSPLEGRSLDSAGADFYLVGNRVNLEDVVLKGNAFTLVGAGTMSLPDGGVELNLVSVATRLRAAVPVLSEVLENASRELIELRITGPLSQPDVRAVPLGSITKEFKELFRRRKPRPIQPAGS